MLIAALVLAVVGLAALVTAVVTGSTLIAWVCIVASAIGVVLLIVDAVRDRSTTDATSAAGPTEGEPDDADLSEGTPEPGTYDYPDLTDGYPDLTQDEPVVADGYAGAGEDTGRPDVRNAPPRD